MVEESRQSSSPAPPGTGRIETFDLLRGYFLVVIVVDHANHFPSLFGPVTGRGQLWASAAEGFFIISGLLVGYIRGRQVQLGAVGRASSKLLTRAATLFGCSIALAVLFTFWGRLSAGNPGVKPGLDTESSIWDLLQRAMTLQYNYGWADFLIFYAVFLAVAPLALLLLRARLGVLVLAISVLVWLFRGSNVFLAWQIYFFPSLVVGYHLRPLEAWARQLPARLAGTLQTLLYLAAAVTVLISATLTFGSWALTTYADLDEPWLLEFRAALPIWAQTINPWFDKWSVEPGGVAIAALWFTALYVLLRRHEEQFVRRLGPLLLPIGRNSLFVYSAQAAIIFGLGLLALPPGGVLINTLTSAILVALVWVLAGAWPQAKAAGRRIRHTVRCRLRLMVRN